MNKSDASDRDSMLLEALSSGRDFAVDYDADDSPLRQEQESLQERFARLEDDVMRLRAARRQTDDEGTLTNGTD